MKTTPQAAAEEPRALARVAGERFTGYAVIGAPFAGGHCLALRRFTAGSVGPAFTAVWHRAPDGRWTVYSDAAPEHGCARYLGSALSRTVHTDVAAEWTDPSRLHITAGDDVVWDVQVTSSPSTALATLAGRLLPDRARHNSMVLAGVARVAGPVLGAGRIRLTGNVPNGQWFRAAPRRLWSVRTLSATVRGVDLGADGPLPEQERLGDFRIPQRALFATVDAWFEPFDPERHAPACPGGALTC
ncbi:hypothetical protein G352_16469 [Rhodococcus ruber BKS 20-38]|uniref:Uncharacterized protein n=1 Tax=Rhodococcus ruber BKS 20-38 TaxID=1278076 RepID=M2XNC9_9NOCA|nr:hypothetical protein [Rhodococcus ruber]EME62526.1 hypothetical protein G352_16469 [Rhodococcus ruber BKS 20-38]